VPVHRASKELGVAYNTAYKIYRKLRLAIYDSTARRLNITNQKVTQLAAKWAGAGGGKAKK